MQANDLLADKFSPQDARKISNLPIGKKANDNFYTRVETGRKF
jgi:hypothetical protein